MFTFKDGNKWIIGSDPDKAHFVFDDPDLSEEHAEFFQEESGISIEILDKEAKSFLNKEPIAGPVLLEEGDELTLGNTVFTFSEKPQEKDANSAAFDAIFEDSEEAKELPSISDEEENGVDTFSPFSSTEEDEKTAYDTIFEEGENRDALPFNLLNESPLILKVIAGPNAGAEIGLEKGAEYILGKDPASADIVFQDLSVSGKHAKIVITSDSSITIEDLGSKNKTLVNGAPTEGAVAFSSQDIISTGTTTFFIIDREADLQTIYAPESTHLDSLGPEKEEEPEEELTQVSWKKEVIPTRYLVFAGSFALIVLMMSISLFSVFRTKEAPHPSVRSEKQRLEAFFASDHEITFNYSPASGKIFIVGHVLTPIRRETLLHKVKSLPFIRSIEENIIVDEYVVQGMNNVLIENMGLKGVTLHAPKAGFFIATGYLETEKELADLSDYLHSNFPYADRLENHVVVETNLREEIQNLILSKGFSGLKMQVTNGMLVLGGLYDETESSKYQDLLQSLRKLRGVRGLKNLAIAAGEDLARIDVSQNYQVSGFAQYDHFNYNVVINGQIFRKGEMISGMRIERILPNRVLLEKNGLKYKIDYTR